MIDALRPPRAEPGEGPTFYTEPSPSSSQLLREDRRDKGFLVPTHEMLMGI